MTRRPRPPDGVSVLDHVLALLESKEIRDRQRFDAAEKAVDRAMAAAEKAVTKAEIAADKRFDLLNELRVGVATKEQFEALEKIVNTISVEVGGMRQRSVGINASWAMMLGAGGLIITLIGVAVAVFVATR